MFWTCFLEPSHVHLEKKLAYYVWYSLKCTLIALCPPGSFLQTRITLPPPPHQYLDVVSGGDDDSNQAFLESLAWPQSSSFPSSTSSACLPCPACSYTEAVGRPVCLPCPEWHKTPIFGSILGEGGEWISSVCPRLGRDHILLGDFVEDVFGQRPVGAWFDSLSELMRISIYVAVAIGAFVVMATAVFLVYRCVDVGETLSRAADDLNRCTPRRRS